MSISQQMFSHMPVKYVIPRAHRRILFMRLHSHLFWLYVKRIVPGTLPKVTTKTKYLGELIFGMGYIRSYCEEEGKDLDEHLERLAVHGLCHLIGYDHESKEEYELMRNMEHGVLKKVKELKEAEEKEQTQQAILSADVESLPSASQISPPTSNKPVAKPTSPSTKSATASGKKRTTKKKREATNFPASALQPNKPPSL